MLQSAGARLLILPISGLATLVTTRIITTTYGNDAYAIFSLIATLPFLIPLTDLGVGAALTNTSAALPSHALTFRATLRKTRLILMGVASVVVLISLSVGALGSWPSILALPNTTEINWGTAIALALFGVAIPGSLGARVLLGIRRNTVVIFVQGATSLVTLAVVVGLSLTDGSIGYILPGSIAGLLLTNWACSLLAFRAPAVRLAKADAAAMRGLKDIPLKLHIWSTALPMVVISFALPLTFQTDRLIISWVSGLPELAIYSAAALVFLPVVSVVQVAGRSLWGDFASVRAAGGDAMPIYRSSLLTSAGLGILGAAGLLVFGPLLSRWATDGQIEAPLELYGAFAAIVVLQAVQAPSGMYLTSPAGLRFQAMTTILMGIVSLPLSIFLTSSFGALGPVLATAGALLCCHVIPCFVRSWTLIQAANRPSNSVTQ